MEEFIVDEKIYYLAGEIKLTGRTLSKRNYSDVAYGQEYDFEVSAETIDEQGERYTFYWIVSQVKGVSFDLNNLDINRTPKRIEKKEV